MISRLSHGWRQAAALILSLSFGSGLLLLTPYRQARADEEPSEAVMVVLGQWQIKNGHPLLVIPIEGALTSKQKNIINGGFTTVSQLTIRQPRAGDKGEAEGETDKNLGPAIYKVRCSVKFDAWEETYDVARLDDIPRTALLHRMSEYADLCLKAEITNEALLKNLAREGGTFAATLIVKQMSIDEAGKIKEWLIQQQSGVMQSLFSHMLGELTINQTAKLRISIPPRPDHGDGRPASSSKVRTWAEPAVPNAKPKG